MTEVIFLAEKLQISKRSAIKGDDGYKTFSIRIKDETVERLDKIADETNRSRNDIIGLMLDFGINNCEITDGKSE
ncbi:MAG: ribbon-helix-helix protein, CopG family [Oscillospiraceae bacterium]|jgi:hypothetical protein|nr:ribbon-helix-helix protein, CopG family [Oscillospiraceae bacterium]